MKAIVFFAFMLVALLINTASAGDGSCSQISRVCVDGPSTKNISGVDVTRSCWRYESKFNCLSAAVNDCQPLVDKGCAQIGSTCIEYVDGTTPPICSLYEQKYQCKDQEGGTSTVMDCSNQAFCVNGNCFDTSYAPDTDFGIAMSALESLRQMGNYLDADSLTLFNGSDAKCSVTLGVFNCCNKNTKAGSDNGSMMSQIGMSSVKSIAGESVKYLGSNYLYDSLYSTDMPDFLADGLGSLFSGGTGDFGFNPSLSLYGVTIGAGSYVPSLSMTQIFASPDLYIGFDPTSFAISVAIQIITSLMQCDEDEQVLALKRGQNLCHSVGSYCDKKVLGICVVKKQSYCCFNSRLARLISVEAHRQLKKSWGSRKNPDCTGLTPEEIAKVDFSQINFDEIIRDIKKNIQTKDMKPSLDRAQQKINNYYQQQ